jgi:hypothetical protein
VLGSMMALRESLRATRLGAWLLLICVATAVTVITINAAALTNIAYFKRQPIFGDTASYFLVQQQIWIEAQSIGRLRALGHDFLQNSRNPGLTLSYFLLPRSSLITLNGHLFYTAIAFFSFVSTFAVCVWRRTGSLLWGCAAAVLPVVAEGFFDPIYQVPSKLPEPPAAFFAGAALFSLLNSAGARSWKWLLLFGVFVSFATLSRFIAAGYVLVICGPILVAYLVRLRREAGAAPAGRALLAVAAPILILTGYFLVKHSAANLAFYAHASYTLRHGIDVVFQQTLLKFATSFLGPLPIALLSTLAIVALAETVPFRPALIADSLWAAFSHILFVIFVLRVADDAPQLIYAYPGLLLLAAAPLSRQVPRKRLLSGTAAFAFALVLAVMIWLQWHRQTGSENFLYPRPPEAKIRALNHGLARAIVETPSPSGRVPTVEAAFSYYGRYIAATSITDFNRVINYQDRFFEIREAQWTFKARDVERTVLFEKAARAIDRSVDFLAVFDDPSSPGAKTMLYDDYTVAMAQDLNAHIAANPQRWARMKTFDSPWGSVTLYRNSGRT